MCYIVHCLDSYVVSLTSLLWMYFSHDSWGVKAGLQNIWIFTLKKTVPERSVGQTRRVFTWLNARIFITKNCGQIPLEESRKFFGWGKIWLL